jgi:hypothetical protein
MSNEPLAQLAKHDPFLARAIQRLTECVAERETARVRVTVTSRNAEVLDTERVAAQSAFAQAMRMVQRAEAAVLSARWAALNKRMARLLARREPTMPVVEQVPMRDAVQLSLFPSLSPTPPDRGGVRELHELRPVEHVQQLDVRSSENVASSRRAA